MTDSLFAWLTTGLWELYSSFRWCR